MKTESLWRKRVYEEMAKIDLSGKILDIGGSEKLGYLKLIKGEHSVDINNIDEEYGCNLNFDLEKPWPLQDASYDALLSLNVMEHIYDFRHVLRESHRVLRAGGKMIIAVPFLIGVHPCPHDYWRFTEESLSRALAEAGFEGAKITPAGYGVFSAAANLKYNFLHKIPPLWKLCAFFAVVFDALLQKTGKAESLSAKRYPLGFLVKAKKAKI